MSSAHAAPPDTPIAVTGATGTVGREVVRVLAEAGAPVRALAPRPEAVSALGVEAVRFDSEDPATYGALDGLRAVFWLRPPPVADVRRVMGPSVQYTAAHGASGPPVGVVLSVYGANPLVPHWHRERIVRRAGPTVVLRPSFLMQNLSGTHAAEIRDRDEVYVPAGGGRTGLVDARDVGEAAARVLLDAAPHLGRTYTLTGSETLTYDDVAATISDVLGRPVVYARALRERKRAESVSEDFARTMGRIYAVARLGLAGRVTDDLEEILGRPPRRFAAFARDVADVWERRPAPVGGS